MALAQTSRARKKDAARRLLEAYDLDGVERWASAEPQAALLLQSLLFDPEDLLCWRTAEALGRVARARARPDPEPAREMFRRTLWLMNDESGGLLWYGPQVLGAILAGVPALRGELLEVLGSFLEEEPFRAGTRWGLWRVAASRPEAAAAVGSTLGPPLAASLADADPAVRGHAALALRAASGPAAAAAAAGDEAPFPVFDFRDGSLRTATVGQAASGAF